MFYIGCATMLSLYEQHFHGLYTLELIILWRPSVWERVLDAGGPACPLPLSPSSNDELAILDASGFLLFVYGVIVETRACSVFPKYMGVESWEGVWTDELYNNKWFLWELYNLYGAAYTVIVNWDPINYTVWKRWFGLVYNKCHSLIIKHQLASHTNYHY